MGGRITLSTCLLVDSWANYAASQMCCFSMYIYIYIEAASEHMSVSRVIVATVPMVDSGRLSYLKIYKYIFNIYHVTMISNVGNVISSDSYWTYFQVPTVSHGSGDLFRRFPWFASLVFAHDFAGRCHLFGEGVIQYIFTCILCIYIYICI